MMDNNFTDTSSNSLNDKENKENPFQNYNYNQINISNEDSIEETENFENPGHKIKWNIKLHSTYHFSQDIERVWYIVRNFEILCLFSNEGHLPCINIKGKDTWKIGNIFKGNFYKTCPFIAKVEKYYSLPEIKEIKWLFNCIEDNSFFTLKISFFKVNEELFNKYKGIKSQDELKQIQEKYINDELERKQKRKEGDGFDDINEDIKENDNNSNKSENDNNNEENKEEEEEIIDYDIFKNIKIDDNDFKK